MLGDRAYLGCPCKIVEKLKIMNNRLNAEVIEQVNDTQELVMLNNFARESNEYVFKKCLQERMSDVASWRWVLNDLSKRLGEAIEALRYEHKAVHVVIGRIIDELDGHCREATQPGVLKPMCDGVEEAILQVRGARIHLSITAQSYANRVDSAIRRRLHSNKVTLQDLNWQKDEAVRDYNALGEELTATEQNLLETMEQERVIGARLADRSYRPVGELTKDQVDRNLRDEQGRVRNFMKQLRANHRHITTLQNNLTDCITRIDCCIEDIMQVVRIDEERILKRLGEDTSDVPSSSPGSCNGDRRDTSVLIRDEPLESIREEDEDNDYPFDD